MMTPNKLKGIPEISWHLKELGAQSSCHSGWFLKYQDPKTRTLKLIKCFVSLLC